MISKADHDFVKVDCKQFDLNGTNYYPLVCNYLINFTYDCNSNHWYLSPNWNYSDVWGNPFPCDPGRFMYDNTNDESIALQKINQDMLRLQNMGFNTIRVPIAPENNSGSLVVPTANYTTYFDLLDQFLLIAAANNIKVIFLVGPKNAWDIHNQFKKYLENIAVHFSQNSSIMAYDLYNEPFFSFPNQNENDKYKISNWVSEWCYTIKEFDKNHLITIGLTGPETCFAWDPMVMPIDFASLHFYSGTEDLNESKNRIAAYIYWASHTISMPWIIGETGYSGTNDPVIDPDQKVGSESDQYDYAIYTMQKSIDCSCNGYSWWQYQEINWQNDFEDHLGIINNYGNNGFADETDKQVAGSFNTFWTLTPNSSNCTIPPNYDNIMNHPNLELTGHIQDDLGNPIANAVIMAWKNVGSNWPNYLALTNANGDFTIYTNTPGYPILSYIISYPGYTSVHGASPTNGITYTLHPVNYNNWTKKWTNDGNNKIDGWSISDFDKFYVGDFNGDGNDEILCTQNTGGSKDWMTILWYDNDKADWEWGWSNYGDATIGDGIYPYRGHLAVGDFDGDGRDDVIGVGDHGGWMTTFYFGTDNDWHWWQSNYGYVNTPGYPMSYMCLYDDYFVTGDFDGDGRDEFLGADLPNGWTTLFELDASNTWKWVDSDKGLTNNSAYPMSYMRPYRDQFIVGDFNNDGFDDVLGNDLPNGWMTTFNYSTGTWQWDWSDYGVDVVGMRPYRNNIIAGDFDEDDNDELLGIYTWATKFDLNNNSFNWSWSTGNTSTFSDWKVWPAKYLYFFVRTYKYSPEQLMAFENHGNNFLVNMYSYNTNLNCADKREYDIKPQRVAESSGTDQNFFNVFPNPSSGNIYLSFRENAEDCTIQVQNTQGTIVKETKINYNPGKQNILVNLDNLSTGIYFVIARTSDNIYSQKIQYINQR